MDNEVVRAKKPFEIMERLVLSVRQFGDLILARVPEDATGM